MGPHKIAIIGSGNWGSAISKIIGTNAVLYPEFEDTVPMWVHEEQVDGKDLTSIINSKHENVKYLAGVKLPENIIAQPDLVEAVKGATLLVFVLPDNFIRSVCETLRGHIQTDALGICLTKGIEVSETGVHIYPDLIKGILGIDTCSLSGANIANEVALEKFGETTIGYRDWAHAEVWQRLFQTDNLRVGIVQDVAGVAMAGALKNIVALAAGFSDGLGYGDNTKSAIMRIGMAEMKKFSEHFFEGIKQQTWIESCGMADIITTCYGGRNRKCAEAFVKTKKPFSVIERELLNGQKLQGTITTLEVHKLLVAKGLVSEFPLFHTVYMITFEGMPPEDLTRGVIGRPVNRPVQV